MPVPVPALSKRHAITGSRLGRYKETRQPPGFRGGGGHDREISRPDFSRKIFNRIFLKKF